MTIIVKIDEEDPFIVKSDSDLETTVLYSNWKHIELYDLDEISEEKRDEATNVCD